MPLRGDRARREWRPLRWSLPRVLCPRGRSAAKSKPSSKCIPYLITCHPDPRHPARRHRHPRTTTDRPHKASGHNRGRRTRRPASLDKSRCIRRSWSTESCILSPLSPRLQRRFHRPRSRTPDRSVESSSRRSCHRYRGNRRPFHTRSRRDRKRRAPPASKSRERHFVAVEVLRHERARHAK